MINERFKKALAALSIFVLASVSVYAYSNFQTFRPSDVQNSKGKVKGSKVENVMYGIPLPPNSEELSSNKTFEGEQIIIKTAESEAAVHTYYQNILLEKGWSVNGENSNGRGRVTRYAKDNKKLTISITTDESINKRIVGIEVIAD